MKQISKIIVLNCYKRKNEGKVVEKIIKTIIKDMSIDLDVEISYDDGSLDIWGNYKQALKIPAKEDERFRFIIHDDLIISRQGIEKMLYILRFIPDNAFVSFYIPRNKGYKECKEKNHRVMKTHSNFWTQAFCFPTNKIDEFIEWGDNKVDKKLRWEDTRIKSYSLNHGIPIYAIVPSLFQHLGAYRSALGFPGVAGINKRYSDMFQPDVEVYNVDWEKEIANPFINENKSPKDIHKYTI